MKRRFKRISMMLMALAVCVSMSSCMEKQQYADFEDGTQDIVFQDVSMTIPKAWNIDEKASQDNGVWYLKENNRATQSMLFITTGTTKEDFDSSGEEKKFFDKYIKELEASDGVKASSMTEPKEITIDGCKTRYIEYQQEIDHSIHDVKTYLVLKGKKYYNISFATYVDNAEDFEQSIKTIKIK